MNTTNTYLKLSLPPIVVLTAIMLFIQLCSTTQDGKEYKLLRDFLDFPGEYREDDCVAIALVGNEINSQRNELVAQSPQIITGIEGDVRRFEKSRLTRTKFMIADLFRTLIDSENTEFICNFHSFEGQDLNPDYISALILKGNSITLNHNVISLYKQNYIELRVEYTIEDTGKLILKKINFPMFDNLNLTIEIISDDSKVVDIIQTSEGVQLQLSYNQLIAGAARQYLDEDMWSALENALKEVDGAMDYQSLIRELMIKPESVETMETVKQYLK